MNRRRVLVLTTDPLTQQMPGPAIRAWHLAEELSAEHQVTLVSTVACEREHPRMRTRLATADELRTLLAWMDVAVVPPGALRHFPELRSGSKPLVVDLYDPFHLENLESGTTDLETQLSNVRHLTEVLNEALIRGDWFCCASSRQRDFWLGSLAALGRVNPHTYAADPTLGRLVAMVPFGVPNDPPTRKGPGLRGMLPGVGADDKVVVWGGGVYNWFDPLSLVTAVDLARRQIPEIRLVFLGMRHPNPAIPEMKVAAETRRLAEKMNLTGRHVFFNEGWLPYDVRADVLLDADVGVSTHLDHIEARFSFRTRVLDYLWTGLPMVLTGGDPLSEVVAAGGAGLLVEPGDSGGIAEALVAILKDPPPRHTVQQLGEQFRWSNVARPLVEFCRAPARSPDVLGGPDDPEHRLSGTGVAGPVQSTAKGQEGNHGGKVISMARALKAWAQQHGR